MSWSKYSQTTAQTDDVYRLGVVDAFVALMMNVNQEMKKLDTPYKAPDVVAKYMQENPDADKTHVTLAVSFLITLKVEWSDVLHGKFNEGLKYYEPITRARPF